MKTTFQKELGSLSDSYDFYLNNKVRKEELITNFSRLKSSEPFSPRLNMWLTNFYQMNKESFIFTDTDEFDSKNISQTLATQMERYQKTGKILVWIGASDKTIFGENPSGINGNWAFRCFHEMTHISRGIGFNFAGESMVCSIQCSMIPVDWVLERELIQIEIIGQNQYFNIHKCFLKDQRKFAIDYMIDPEKAIFTKQ